MPMLGVSRKLFLKNGGSAPAADASMNCPSIYRRRRIPGKALLQRERDCADHAAGAGDPISGRAGDGRGPLPGQDPEGSASEAFVLPDDAGGVPDPAAQPAPAHPEDA